MDIGAELGDLRRSRGLTQLDLAVASRIGLAQLDALEREEPQSMFSELIAAAHALDLRVEVVPIDENATWPAVPLALPHSRRDTKPAHIPRIGGRLTAALDQLCDIHGRRGDHSAPCQIELDYEWASDVAEVVWGREMTVQDHWRDLPRYRGVAVSLVAGLGDAATLVRYPRLRRWPDPVARVTIAPGGLNDDQAEIYHGLRRDQMSSPTAAAAASLL